MIDITCLRKSVDNANDYEKYEPFFFLENLDFSHILCVCVKSVEFTIICSLNVSRLIARSERRGEERFVDQLNKHGCFGSLSQYLEMRFGKYIRKLNVAMFILVNLFFLPVIMYIPSLAFAEGEYPQ